MFNAISGLFLIGLGSAATEMMSKRYIGNHVVSLMNGSRFIGETHWPCCREDLLWKFVLRIDAELHTALAIKASRAEESLNVYCQKILKQSVLLHS